MSKHSIRIGICSMPSVALEAVERLDALRAAALGAEPVLVEREPRVALGQLEDAALVAALGVADLDRARRAARSSASLERVGVASADARHDHLRRDRERRRVVLEHELLGHLALARARPAFSR